MRRIGDVVEREGHITADRIELRPLDEELGADDQGVRAAAGGDGVVAGRRQEDIVADRALDQGVVAGAAGQRIDDLVNGHRHRGVGGRIFGAVMTLPAKHRSAVKVRVGHKSQVVEIGQRDLLADRHRRRAELQVAVAGQAEHLNLDQIVAVAVGEFRGKVGRREGHRSVLIDRRLGHRGDRRRGVRRIDGDGDRLGARQPARVGNNNVEAVGADKIGVGCVCVGAVCIHNEIAVLGPDLADIRRRRARGERRPRALGRQVYLSVGTANGCRDEATGRRIGIDGRD